MAHSTFSYAQAAMGKASPVEHVDKPKNGPTASSDDAKASPAEATNNTERGNASVAIDSPSLPGVGASNGLDLEAESAHTQANGVKDGASSALASPDFAVSRSASIGKEDEHSPGPSNSEELSWRRRPHDIESVNGSSATSDVLSQQSDGKLATASKTPVKPMVEAPIPTVNVWKKRAESAIGKGTKDHAADSPSNGSNVSTQSSPTISRNDASGIGATKQAVVATQTTTNGSIPPGRSGLSQHFKPNGDANTLGGRPYTRRKSSATEKTTSNNTPPAGVELSSQNFPSMQDAQLRPRFEHSKDNEGSKNNEKADIDRPSQPQKSHGKTQYVQMDFTPTVKFETPLPPTSRRGGRGGARGGREGSTRGALSSSNTSAGRKNAGDHPAAPTESGRPGRTGGDLTRAAADATKSRRQDGSVDSRTPAGSQNETFMTPRSKGFHPPPKAGVVDQTVGPTYGKSDEIGMQAARRNKFATPHNNTLPNQNGAVLEAQSSNENSQKERRRSSVRPTDSSDNFALTGWDEQRKPEGYNGSKRSSWNERKHDPSNDAGEGRESAGRQNSREFGRFERGRGGRGGARGGFNGPPALPHLHTGPIHSYYPSSPQSSRSVGYSPFQQQHMPNGRNYRGGPRSASIPNDPMAVPRYGYYTGPPSIAPYGSDGYDIAMQPMTAMNYNPYINPMILLNGIASQLNYYFSVDNLCKDLHLRKQMDAQGFVPLPVIAGFARMKNLTTDLHWIKSVAISSPEFEVREGRTGGPFVRRREGWEKFVLPVEDRDPNARHSGPAENEMPVMPYGQSFIPQNVGVADTTAETNFSSAINTSGPSTMEQSGTGASSGAPGIPELNGTNGVNHLEQQDAFQDDQVQNLTIVMRSPPGESGSSVKSESNAQASVPTPTPNSASFESSGLPNHVQQNTLSAEKVGDSEEESAVMLKSEKSALIFSIAAPVRPASVAAQNGGQFWFKENSWPEPLRQGSQVESYSEVRRRALELRQMNSPDRCPYEMRILYQFWAHFLVRNFNNRMYTEFVQLALQDAGNGVFEGLSNLLQYFGEATNSNSPIRSRVARDYASLVQDGLAPTTKPAFAQLYAQFSSYATPFTNLQIINNYLIEGLRSTLD